MPWKLINSIFKGYKETPKQLLDRIFEFDFKIGNIQKTVKDDEKELKLLQKTLKSYYYIIFNSYKWFSCYGAKNKII